MRRDLVAEIEAKRALVPEEHKPDEVVSVQQPFVDAHNAAPNAAAEMAEPVEIPASLGSIEAALSEQPPAPTPEAAPSTADKAAADEEYHGAVGEVHERERALDRTLKNQVMGSGDDYADPSLRSGYRSPVVTGQENADGSKKAREKRQRQAMNQHMMLLAQLNNRLDGLYKERDYWQGEVEKYAKQENAVEKYLEALGNGEDPNLTEEEQRDLDEAIRLYEEKYGVTVDRNDATSMQAVLDYATENKKSAARELTQTEKDIERTEALKQQIENDPDNPENTQLVQDLNRTDEGKETLDKITAEAETFEQEKRVYEDRQYSEEEVAVLEPEDASSFFASDDLGAVADQVEETPIIAASIKPTFDEASKPGTQDSAPEQEIAALETNLDKAPGATV